MRRTAEQRFWAKIRKTRGCWLWLGVPNSQGYGQIHVNGKTIGAHRFSYALHNGKIPRKLYVLHSCDVRNCVKPAHLWLGTQLENLADRDAKGRGVGGILNGRAKLSEIQVKNIRLAYATGTTSISKLAKIYPVNEPTICKIIKKKLWANA